MEQIVAATAWQLSNPAGMSSLARYFRGQAPTANLVRDLICGTVWEWHAAGNLILMPTGEHLDIERMERLGEASVYSGAGKIIFLEDSVPLIRLDDAFGENTRRTINRVFEKAARPSKRRVDKRLLPLMFWMNAARRIIECGGGR